MVLAGVGKAWEGVSKSNIMEQDTYDGKLHW
jgi:hypothetical protein